MRYELIYFDAQRWSMSLAPHAGHAMEYAVMSTELAERCARQTLVPEAYDEGAPESEPPKPPPGEKEPPVPTDVPVPEPRDVPVPEPLDVPPPDPRDVPPPGSRPGKGSIVGGALRAVSLRHWRRRSTP